MSRFLKPDLVRINLSGGDWILIKRQLTAGEERRVFARTTKAVKAGEAVEIDLEKVGLSNLVEYLVDWSFTDQDGKPVIIRDMPAAFVMDTINSLDTESFAEISRAISAHEATLEEEKKTRSTASGSLVT